MQIFVLLIWFASIGFGLASAIFWLRAARVRSPEKVAATWDGGGPLQQLADAVGRQSTLNATAAWTAAVSMLLQGVLVWLV